MVILIIILNIMSWCVVLNVDNDDFYFFKIIIMMMMTMPTMMNW